MVITYNLEKISGQKGGRLLGIRAGSLSRSNMAQYVQNRFYLLEYRYHVFAT